jgi:hypothetical protein
MNARVQPGSLGDYSNVSQDLIHQTSEQLKRAIVGTRFWFCLWPEADLSAARLLVTPLQRDPGQRELSALIARQGRVGGRVLRGIATAGPDGSLVFGGVGLQRDDLLSLADWVKEHGHTQEGLRLLGGTVFLSLDGSGRVLERIEEPYRWSVAEAAPLPGSPQSAAARLDKIPVGASVWFWMTDRALDGRPALVIERATRDRQMTRLRDLVQGLRGGGIEVSGTLRRVGTGALVFITSDPLKSASRVLACLIAAYPDELAVLRAARLARTGEEGLSETGTAPPVSDMDSTIAALTALQEPGDRAWFVYTRQPDGSVALHVAGERSMVQPVAMAAGGADCLTGSVERSRAGWLLFQSRSAREGFVEELAGWTRRHHRSHPELSCLRGSRYTVRADKDTITHREKNDTAWTFLN